MGMILILVFIVTVGATWAFASYDRDEISPALFLIVRVLLVLSYLFWMVFLTYHIAGFGNEHN